MKIGIFTDTYLPDINGVVTSVELLRKKLEEAGHDAYVICTYKGMYKIKVEGKIIRLPGVEVKKLYGYALTTPVHFLFIDELKKLNLDLIHAETEFGVGIFANIVASHLNLPIVRTYHTTYEDYTHYINFLKSDRLDVGLKKFVAYWSKLYCNNCVKLITPSNKTKEMLENYGVRTAIDVIPTGIELERFKSENNDLNKSLNIRKEYGIKDDEKLLIFVGRIAKEKSIDMIIDAFKKVKADNLKIKLLIVGAGPSLDELINYTKDNDLSDYIFFAGKKPFSEVPTYYHAADGFISASTSETQGMTYIEALASGLVVLAHFDEVLDDIIIENKNGYFFNDANDIYETIVKFNNLSKKELDTMAEYASKSVEKYDANIFGDTSIKLYEEAIEDYKYSYEIIKTSLKDDSVVLYLRSYDKTESKLTVSLDDYYNLGFRNNSIITRYVYDDLKNRENMMIAYRACLKRLGNRDYSIKEMKDYLASKFELSKTDIKQIINKLEEYGLLDDYKYAVAKVSSFKANLYSKKMMSNKLNKLGISKDIIEKTVLNDLDDELLACKKMANKYLKATHNKSLSAAKESIYAKLLTKGFSHEVIKQALDVLDFSNLTLGENEVLKKEAIKARKKYEKKYDGTDLRNRVYLYLVSKGFNYDSIYAVINEMEL